MSTSIYGQREFNKLVWFKWALSISWFLSKFLLYDFFKFNSKVKNKYTGIEVTALNLGIISANL